MKKTLKLLSILLFVCVLASVTVIASSAVTSDDLATADPANLNTSSCASGDGSAPEDELEINLKANLTLHDQFKFNIYVPADIWEKVASAKINGVSVPASEMEIEGKDYYAMSHPIKANYSKDEFKLALELNQNGTTITKEYTFSIPGYIEKVREGEFSAVVDALMDATENYISAVYNYANGETNTVVTTYSPTKTGTTAGKFTNIKINLALTDSIVFQFTADTATKMTFTLPSMKNGKLIYNTVETGSVTSYDVRIPVRFLNEGITIKVGSKSGTYYIDDYIRAVAGDSDAKLVALTKAIGTYAKAANDYATSDMELDTPVINFSVAGESIDKIVYNSNAAKSAAETLAAAMAKKGHVVDVILDTKMAATQNAIRISVNSPNNNYDYKITVDGTNLVINTGFASFIGVATDSFIAESIKPATESVDFDVDFTKSYTTDKIYYSDFGAVGDGITDDFFKLRSAHEFANSAKRYTVCADAGKTYYIHETRVNGTGDSPKTITIKTNVNWTGAEFIIDDTDISTSDGTRRTNAHIFEIPAQTSMQPIRTSATLQAILAAGLNPETKKIDLGLNKKVMIIPTNTSHRIYRHRGYSSGWQGIPMSEIIVLDANGNVDPTTPVMFDYNNLNSIEVYSLTDAPLTIEGGKFTTRASHIDIGSSSGNISRGISIMRPNVTFKNVEHYITGEITLNEQASGMRGAAYNGFFTFTYTSDVTLDGCVLTGRRCYATALGNDGAPGTYAISAISVNKLVLKNCVQSNFWISIDSGGNMSNATENTPNAQPSMAPSSILKGSRMHWGSIGTNYCKNMEVYNSTISRFDAHSSLYNGKIIDSTLNFISLAGGGELIIENVRWFAEKPSKTGNSLIYLREDYGSSWNGTIKMDGVDAYAYTSGDNYTGAYLVFHLYYNWYNGYDTYYPSLDINNLNYYDIQTRQKLPAGFEIKLCDRGVLNEPALHLPTTVNRHPLRGTSQNGTEDKTTKENINIVTPPEFIKITGNDAGYVYVIPNTGRRGIDSDGGYYNDDETYGGFFGDTKFYYGDGENDYYLGTKHVGEKTTTFMFHSGDNYN